MDFSRLLSWAPLHDLTTSWFPGFFLVLCSETWEFCLFCCSLTLSWLGLHPDPCAEVDREKQQGYTLPFWNHNSIKQKNSSLLSFLWVSLVGGHHYQIVWSQRNYLLWVNYKCSDFVLFWSSEEINMNCVQSIAQGEERCTQDR